MLTTLFLITKMAFVSFAYNGISTRVHHSFVIIHTALCFWLKITSSCIAFEWFNRFKMCLKMFFVITSRFEHFVTELAWPKVSLLGMTIFHMRTKIRILEIVIYIFTYLNDENDEWDWRQPGTGHLYTCIWLLWCNIKYRSLPKDFLHIEHSCVLFSDWRLN